METIAIYWESKIRIYGTTIKKDLTFVQITYPFSSTITFAAELASLTSTTGKFYHLQAQTLIGDRFQFSIVMTPEDAKNLSKEFKELFIQSDHTSLDIYKHVELIALHGPHFQDRYGIAETAYSLLQENDFELLAYSCTGTSITLVVPESTAQSAVECLGKSFVVPAD